MNTNGSVADQLVALAEKRISNDIVKQIRKLRWIGMDDEAMVLQVKLHHIRIADVVLSSAPETD